jgi:hypothetical protein
MAAEDTLKAKEVVEATMVATMEKALTTGRVEVMIALPPATKRTRIMSLS